MQNGIHLGTAAQRADMLLRLGVSKEVVSANLEEPDSATSTAIEPLGRRLDRSDEARRALLFVPFLTDRAAFDLLVREDSGAWHVSDEIVLAGWGDKITYERLGLSAAGGGAILVHGVDSGHGTSFQQSDTDILIPRGGKFVSILRAREAFSGQVFDHERGYELLQKNAFVVFPGDRIEETRTSSREDIPVCAERRIWTWSGKKQEYLPGAFHVVAGTPQPAPE